MFGLGPTELIIIFLIVLLVFGWNRLPQIGKGLGEGIRNFRTSMREAGDKSDDEKSEPDKGKK